MAVGLPLKTTYVDGEVFSASDINDTNGTVNLLNPSAKGSIISASAANTPSLLAVGANDLVLTAASGETTGLKYSGGYSTWTPTWTGLTVGNATQTARYTQVGKTVRFDLELIFGSTTSITASFPSFTYPVGLLNPSCSVSGMWLDQGTAVYINSYFLRDSSRVFLITGFTGGSYLAETGVSSTIPFTWTTGDRFIVSGSYEVA